MLNFISDSLSNMQKNRDESYDKAARGEGIDVEWGVNLAADAFLPMDAVYTANKAARGEAITAEDLALSAVDVVSTGLGLVSFGAGKVAGSGLKALIKGAKVASPIVGVGGSVAVTNYYDTGNTEDGSKDTNPSENASSATGTTPNITINVKKSPQTKNADNTDTQGLNDVLLAYALTAAMNQKSTTTATTNTTSTATQKTGFEEYLPIILLIGLAVLAIILLTRR